jgi:hypothetical protein
MVWCYAEDSGVLVNLDEVKPDLENPSEDSFDAAWGSDDDVDPGDNMDYFIFYR